MGKYISYFYRYHFENDVQIGRNEKSEMAVDNWFQNWHQPFVSNPYSHPLNHSRNHEDSRKFPVEKE